MRAALAITARDVRQKLRDRSAILLAVVAPLMLAFLFSVMLPEPSSFSATYALADLDGGDVAAGLVEGPLAGLVDEGVAAILPATDEAAARAAVEEGSAGAALVIPAGFSDAVRAARPAELRIVGDIDAVLATQVLRSVAEGYASSVAGVQLAVATVVRSTGEPPDPARLESLADRALAAPVPITIERDGLSVGVASHATYYSAAMAVLFVFFAAQFGVVSLHAERRGGTLARMLAAPVSPHAIVMGKVLVSVVLGIVSMTILVLASTLLMAASWGDPLGVAALIVAVVLAACGIALLAVSFTRTEEQAGGLVAIVAMVLAAFGGSFFPLSQAPELLAGLSLLTPHAWFLRGVDGLAGGAGAATVLPAVAVLLAIAAITGGLGLARAQRLVLGR